MSRHEVQAEFLQAVAQTTRLRILEVLAEGERCVCNIYQAIGEEQSNVSIDSCISNGTMVSSHA